MRCFLAKLSLLAQLIAKSSSWWKFSGDGSCKWLAKLDTDLLSLPLPWTSHSPWREVLAKEEWFGHTQCSGEGSLVALYRAIRLRIGYDFESCHASGKRNIKNTNSATRRPVFFPPLLLVGSQESVLKVPKPGQFHAEIRETMKRCDSCAQGALGRRTVSRRNLCDAESLAKRHCETCH